MSSYMSHRYASLTPYVPGEQPRDRKYVKLNTNESPYPPPRSVVLAAEAAARSLNLYSDPQLTDLRDALAEAFGVKRENVTCTNGSDEALDLAVMAYADRGFAFPDVTYGFYPVFCSLHAVSFREIPLREDFTVCADDYIGIRENAIIANPNAPTGIALDTDEIERIVRSDGDRIVIVDEAYVDFGGKSAAPLTAKYPNLLVVGTFSKSRSLAGGRLGYAVGCEELISDIETLRYSVNPYNVNSMTLAAGLAALKEAAYYREKCLEIAGTREYTAQRLRGMGFTVLPSSANFLFVKRDGLPGGGYCAALREKGVLVRHFGRERIRDFCRVTIGSREQMDAFLMKTEEILDEKRADRT